MTQAQTDLATVTTAVENIYEHAGPAVTFEGQALADLQEAPPDVASAITALQAAETHVAYMAFQAATAQQGATALAADLAPVTPPPPATLTLTAIPGQSATVGTAITAIKLASSGGTGAVTFAVTGLPAGLALSGSTISGTPTVAGTSTVTIKATDSGTPVQTASETFTVVVASAVTPPPTTGVTVTKPNVTGGPPPVRGEPGSAYHPGTGLIYYFGGNNAQSGALGDTWSFNPVNGAWTKLAATAPGNVAISLTYDPVTKTIIMFGGDNGNTSFNTTYSLDPTAASPTWKKLSPATSPAVRSGHCDFNDPITGDVMIYGGNALGVAAAFDDLWRWTGTNWVEVSSALTGTGRTGAFAGTLTNGTTVIFGGNGSGLFNDTHVWNGTTCVKASPATSPPARRFGGGAPTNDGRFLIYAGTNADFSVNSSDCWTWNGTNWTKQTPAGVTIGGLSSQAMNLHPPTGEIVMAFGTAGASASSESGDIYTVYIFTLGTVTPPPPAGLSITTASLPGGTVGTAYSATLASSGGTGTDSWSATGLPAGLTLSAAGVLSGTPTTAATYSTLTVTLKDSNNDTPTTKTFTVVVAPASVTPPPPPPSGTPILGLYIGGPGAAPVNAFAATLGVTCQAFGAYDTRDTWADIAGSTWIEDGADGMRLIAGIGLCPTGVSLTAVPANVSVFATVAAALAPGTIVRLGWEFDGGWYAWGINYPGNTPASYAAAWQAVVPVMRAANPGLLFDFCSNAGSSQTMAQLAAFYPGDQYVDYIGCDHYDNQGGGGSPTPMTPVIQLAAARGKPFSCGEWGLNGADNPTFITEMAQVFLDPAAAAAKWGWPVYTCAYQSYFSADLSINSTLNAKSTPNSVAAYKAAFA